MTNPWIIMAGICTAIGGIQFLLDPIDGHTKLGIALILFAIGDLILGV